MSKESGNGKYYAGFSEMSFDVGPFDTPEEAIEEFKSENEGAEPGCVGIGRDVYCNLDGRSIVEQLSEGSLYDELYEDALDGWCDIPRSDKRWDVLTERLTKVLHDWLDEVGEPKMWTVIEPFEIVQKKCLKIVVRQSPKQKGEAQSES